MTPEERRRAGRLVAARIKELGMTTPALAEKAGVDATTVRALIKGVRWPQARTWERLDPVLGFDPGEVAKLAVGSARRIEDYSTQELLAELCRRSDEGTL